MANDQKILLDVQGLSVAFGTGERRVDAVRGLSYTFSRGETLAIVGESGSGKSVSSLALMGLLPRPGGTVTGGRALFMGQDLLPWTRRRCSASAATASA